jgi:hypothetical protein
MTLKVKFIFKKCDFNTKNIEQKQKRMDEMRKTQIIGSNKVSTYYNYLFDYNKKQLPTDRFEILKKLDNELFLEGKIPKRFFK